MKPIVMETLFETRFIGQLKTSPEKTRYAYTVSKAMVKENCYHHTLYVNDEKVRLLKKNSGYIFLDEDTLLLDLQKNKQEEKALEEKKEKSIYRFDLKTRTLSRAFTLPFPFTLEEALTDEFVLVSAALKPSDHVLYEGEKEAREAYLKEEKEAALYEDIEDLPYQFNGANFTTKKVKQYFLYNLKEEKVVPFLSKTMDVSDYFYNKEDHTFYFIGKPYESLRTFTNNLYVYDFKEKTEDVLYSKRDMNLVKVVKLKDEVIVLARTMKHYGLNENGDFYGCSSGEMTLLAKHGESFGNTIGTDVKLLGSTQSFVHDDAFYFVTTVDDHSEVRKLSKEGELSTHFVFDGSLDGLALSKDGVLAIALKGKALQELYTLDFSHKTSSPLTAYNKPVLEGLYTASCETVEVAKDTHTVKGFVLLPKDYTPTKKYPAILNIHGGPKTVYGKIFYHEMQVWANMGYVVMFSNPRGSDGKGNAFADIRGKYGTIDYEDLMAFTDAVIARYEGIDVSKLFVTGGSYGGFMTNWIIGHTDRFKAAVTQRSIASWDSFYGTSDIGYFFASDQTGGDPLNDREKLYAQSPIKYVDRVKTPLLILHADQDHRCPIEQAQQFYAHLKVRKVETKFVWMKGENHELSRSGKPQARMKRLKEITGWFEKYKEA